jgi:predicted site-specific integrase-resolvase
MGMDLGVFFFQFFDVTEVVIIHKDDLARFGYRLDMKVEKIQNISIFLTTYWNLS